MKRLKSIQSFEKMGFFSSLEQKTAEGFSRPPVYPHVKPAKLRFAAPHRLLQGATPNAFFHAEALGLIWRR
ncbi:MULTISPECIES: hypothetical protein [Rhizobium]|uniref:hypothetical protein n=1 Tax=Rhizobium TaxID=379 RepID=UPI0011443BB3|nr:MULTISPECIES: hypothetical protein [Rhizobium]WET72951.1 hypothetical protein PYR68_16030 [Rhizobium croatiense]